MATVWIVWLVILIGGGGLFIYSLGASFGGWKAGLELLLGVIAYLTFWVGVIWLIVATVNQISFK